MWQFATYNRDMAQSIRISDDLYAMAQSASQALARPLAQQMEYWARLGAALDAAGLSTPKAMELLGHGAHADEFLDKALRQKAEESFTAALRERHRKYAEDVAAGRRSPRSLLMFQKGDLKGYTLTRNPESEFERCGDGW